MLPQKDLHESLEPRAPFLITSCWLADCSCQMSLNSNFLPELHSSLRKVSPTHQVCHILHSICYLLYSVMALLKKTFSLTFIFTKKNTNGQFFFSLERLKAISLKYLKSLMVRFFVFFLSYKIKIPFEFSDVQKEIEMNHHDHRISLLLWIFMSPLFH